MATIEELGKYNAASISKLDKTFSPIVKEYLKKFTKDHSVGLALSGPHGVGKTYAAAAILNQMKVKNARLDTCFLTSPKIYQYYYDIGRQEYADTYRGHLWWNTLEEIPVLVWNDLGKENRTGGYADQVIYAFGRLLRERVERGLSTIFTTNLRLKGDKGTIATTYGDGFDSLFAEATSVRFEVTGPDRRRTNM